MSLYLGPNVISGTATNTKSNAHSLLDFKWSDHILNEMCWLRADTFSWQSGLVYVAAYQHLTTDYTNGISKTETVGGYTITYVEATDGHKITTDEANVINIYNATGVAWFYVIDTVNQRFKLPRTKYGFTGLRDSAGKYVPETLPNIIGRKYYMAMENDDTQFGALFRSDVVANSGYLYDGTGAYYQKAALSFNASLSNSTYQDGAPVQQRATQMYLYFYVGEFDQSATEQTAGITTAQLNAKLDLDLGNVTNTSKEAIVAFNVPNYANGSEYTENTTFYADKDYYVLCYVINGNYYGNIYADSALQTNLFNWQFYIQASANSCRIPVCVLPKGTYYTSNSHCFLFPFKGES